jgi:hypothetical protein
MNDPQAKTAPTKEAIEEVLRQCESLLLALFIALGLIRLAAPKPE